MKHSLRLIYMSQLAAMLVACSGDPIPFNLPPTLTVSEASDIYRKGATISGTYTKANDEVVIKTFGLYYGLNDQLYSADSVLATSADLNATTGSYTITLENLSPATTYYYATFASSGYSIAKSEIRQFRTSDTTEPKVGTVSILDVNRTSVDVSSTILDDGGSDITIRGFLVREAPSDVASLGFEDKQVLVTNNEEFQATITDLSPSTRYAICAYAMTAKAYGFSEILYVTTSNQDKPKTSQVSAYTTNAAQTLYVTASILDEGTNSVTECGFVYSTDTNTPTVESNRRKQAVRTDKSFTASLTDLIPNQTNYIRAYAKSSDGIGYGETFTYNETDFPVLTTQAAYDIQPYQASLSSAIDVRSSSITECGFLWSDSNNVPSFEDNKKVVTFGSSISTTLTELNDNVLYYYRPFARHAKGVSYGAVMQFTTIRVQQAELSAVMTSNITPYTASFAASVTNLKNGTLTDAGFVYSTSPNPTIANKRIPLGATTTLSAQCSGLSDNTTYYVRAYATNEKGTSYGEQATFKTIQVSQAELSAVTTSNITPYTASFAASVTNLRNGTLTDAGFVYSTSPNPTISDKRIPLGANTSLSAQCSGLSDNTTYYVRAYATNEKGTSYGEQTTFKTIQVSQAELSAVNISDITSYSALFEASVTNLRNGTLTDAGFVYSTSPNPTISDKRISLGAVKSLSAQCSTLSEFTTYYIKAYAINEKGTSYGEQATFKTNKKVFIDHEDYDDVIDLDK